MNEFNIKDSVYFVRYSNGFLRFDKMEITLIKLVRDYIVYEGLVYELDSETNEYYIWDESEEIAIHEEHIFSTKEEVLDHINSQIQSGKVFLK